LSCLLCSPLLFFWFGWLISSCTSPFLPSHFLSFLACSTGLPCSVRFTFWVDWLTVLAGRWPSGPLTFYSLYFLAVFATLTCDFLRPIDSWRSTRESIWLQLGRGTFAGSCWLLILFSSPAAVRLLALSPLLSSNFLVRSAHLQPHFSSPLLSVHFCSRLACSTRLPCSVGLNSCRPLAGRLHSGAQACICSCWGRLPSGEASVAF
jgi:hypothetical protein